LQEKDARCRKMWAGLQRALGHYLKPHGKMGSITHEPRILWNE